MKQRLFILSQYLLPHHLLSRLIGCAAECRAAWFKDRLIGWFAKQYRVDMSDHGLRHRCGRGRAGRTS